jgi:hypothetical protein
VHWSTVSIDLFTITHIALNQMECIVLEELECLQEIYAESPQCFGIQV